MAKRGIERLKRSAEWRFLGAFWRAERTLTIAWWALIGIRGALPAFFALAMGALVAAVQGNSSLGPALMGAGVAFVAMNALSPIHGTIGSLLGQRVGAWLNDRLLEACTQPAGLAHLERPDLADDLGLARDFDQGVTAPPLSAAVPEMGNGFAIVVGGFAQAVLLMTYRWWAGLLIGVAWTSTHVLLKQSANWKIYGSPQIAKQNRHVDYAYRLAVDSPASKEVRLFGLADWTVERFADIRRKLTDILFEERKLHERPLSVSLAVVLIGNAVVFWSLARDATAGALTLDALVVFAQAAVGASALAFSEFDWWFRGSAQPIPKVLGIAEQMDEAGALPTGMRSAEGLPQTAIRFEGVGFTYPTTGVNALEGFDLTIEAGSSLAIVGPNGAGKTTLAKLLCRLYDPQEGAIRVDGIDLRELDVVSWRSRIAAVFQDFVRYELSLRANVGVGSGTDEQINRALERGGAAGLAELDTVLSKAYEGGTDLSGGQWQRVAVARALCAVEIGAGVVLLDEPTAQLDIRGEAEIFDRILTATRGLTTILISHRFSTVRHADRICVLEGGRVVEYGSHDELVATGGRYKTMFELQASRFYEEAEEPEDETADIARR